MQESLISPRTRLKFREYFVNTSLAHIDDAFALAGIKAKEDFVSPVSGARRSRVEQYYTSVDFSKWADARRVLAVYEHVLDELERQVRHGDEYAKKYAMETFDTLLECLHRDGFDWADGRLVERSRAAQLDNFNHAIVMVDAPEFARQLSRLREAVDEDPSLAIGTAKEMLETTCKTILEDLWIDFDPAWDLPELLKATSKELKLLPEDIPDAARGAEIMKRLLSSLGPIGHGLAELRNL